MRFLLIVALCLATSPAGAQAWKLHEAQRAIRHPDPRNTGRPPMTTPAERNAIREQCAQIAENEMDGSREGNSRAQQIADLIRKSMEPE